MKHLKDSYNVEIVFRGLCLGIPQRDKSRMLVALVDARRPTELSAHGSPYREHFGVLEFFWKDWKEPGTLSRFSRVSKPEKDDVAIGFLEKEDIRFSAETSNLQPDFEIIDSPNDTSYHRLTKFPSLGNTVRPHAGITGNDPPQTCLARVFLDAGKVGSERVSVEEDQHAPDGVKALTWRFGSLGGEEFFGEPRTINLDIKATLEVPREEKFKIHIQSFRTGDEDTIELYRGGEDLKLWIKNRELDLILRESDNLNELSGCDHTFNRDDDFELFYSICQEPPEIHDRLYLFHADNGGPIAGGGCKCGCAGIEEEGA